MVTGQQTVEFDLSAVEHCKTLVVWGMNWITTKMPDAHWLTEARLKGTRVVVIACEYSATATKGDDVIVVRPGTTPALALGLANVILREKLYDADYVRQWTDLPILVRMDTLKYLRAAEVFGGVPAELKSTTAAEEGREGTAAGQARQDDRARRDAAGVGRLRLVGPRVEGAESHHARQRRQELHVGDAAAGRRGRSDAGRRQEGPLPAGVRPGPRVRGALRSEDDRGTHLGAGRGRRDRSRGTFAKEPGTTLFAIGMGPNQFFNNDNKDRDIFLLAALTGNVGKIGGNVGSYAGNYRMALFNGAPQYINENPFDIELDPAKPARPKQYWKPESAHYYNHEDHPLRVGKKLLTGKTHMPAPDQVAVVCQRQLDPGQREVALQHGGQRAAADRDDRGERVVVVDVVRMGRRGLRRRLLGRAEASRHDGLGHQSVPVRSSRARRSSGSSTPSATSKCWRWSASKLAELTEDNRFNDYWKFVREGRTDVYLQRILDHSTQHQGLPLRRSGGEGQGGRFPRLMNSRTTPKAVGYEQVTDSRPWYTKSGPAGVLPRRG